MCNPSYAEGPQEQNSFAVCYLSSLGALVEYIGGGGGEVRMEIATNWTHNSGIYF